MMARVIGKIGQQSHVAGQHGFALVAEILKGGYGVAQIDGDTLPHIALERCAAPAAGWWWSVRR